jgi:hypothetical protein
VNSDFSFQKVDGAGFPAHTRRMAKKTAAKSTTAEPAYADVIIEGIFSLTKIAHRFLLQIKEFVDFEVELAGSKN